MIACRHLVLVVTLLVVLGAPRPGSADPDDEASIGGRTVSAWQADLELAEAQQRYDALVALAAIGPDADDATAAVANRLDDDHPQIASEAALTLARLAERGALALIAALGSEHARVRALAADALTFSEPPRGAAADALVDILGDENENVRLLAAFALTAVAPERPESLGLIRVALESGNPAAEEGALDALARLETRGVELIAAVRPFLLATDERRLMAAGRALRAMGPAVLPVLLGDLRDADASRSADGVIVTIAVVAELGRADPKTARTLIELARSADDEVAHAALRLLPQVGIADAEIAAALQALVLGSRENVSLGALEALASLGLPLGEDSFEAVLARIRDSLTPETLGRALAGFTEASVQDRMLQLVRGLDEPVARQRAIRALAAAVRANDAWRATALECLAERLGDADPRPRAAAADALFSLAVGDTATVERIAALAEFVEEARRAAPRRAFAELFARSRSEARREGASDAPWAAVEANTGDTLDRIVIGDDPLASAWARLARGPTRSVDIVRRDLVSLLGSEHVEVRMAACEVIGWSVGGADALARVIADPLEHPSVRRVAARGYGTQPEVAEEILERLVTETSPSRYLWWSAAVGLPAGTAEILRPVIGRGLDDPEPAVRAAAGLVLSRAGVPSVEHLAVLDRIVENEDGERLASALGTLLELGPRAVAVGPTVFERMVDAPRGERVGFATALAQMNVAEVYKTLRPDADWDRVLCALQVIEVMGEAASLRDRIASCAQHPDSEVRASAVRLLSSIGAAPGIVVDVLEAALADPVGRVRAEAAASLGSLGKAAASVHPALERVAASDRFAFVRSAAHQAARAVR